MKNCYFIFLCVNHLEENLVLKMPTKYIRKPGSTKGFSVQENLIESIFREFSAVNNKNFVRGTLIINNNNNYKGLYSVRPYACINKYKIQK